MNRKIKVSSIISILFCLAFSVSTVAAGTTQYQYDDLHRLTRVERSDGTVTVYEYDDLGNRTRMLVTSNSNITALFTASPTSGVYPLAVDFTDQSTGDITSWSWDFGDGETSTEQNPSHTYNAPGTYTVTLSVTGPGGSDTETKPDYILVENVEDFETGDLSKFPWITSGDGLWAVTNTNPHSGSYAAESPSIGDSESAALEITMYCQEGEISFWLSVSSEENADHLYFYVDDELQGVWSGSVAYTHTNYMVPSGVHSFEWVYAKDGSGSDGSDAAWLDDISFPETVGTDSDGDGLTDELENSMCTDPLDADTDDDGIPDGYEHYNYGTDPCSIDTDGDGIQDGTELGYTLDDIGPDTDTNIFQPDLDPSTTTDPLKVDSDGDGIEDGIEDPNHNGKIDEGETDSSDNDTDSDGILDGFDNCPNTYNPDQADSDGDGVGNVCDDDNIEDFETGDLSKFPWVTTGDGLWAVTSTHPHSGYYATESPSIGDSESATIETTMYCEEGEISFWYSVSSEENGDYLYFYVDDVLEGSWSGSVAYTRTAYTVTPGTHIFEWVYEKDESGSAGSDAVWLDDISFPVSEVPIVIEDFETGDLSEFSWITSGYGHWDVTSTYPHRGSCAAESPSIGDNESATIETTLYCDEGEMSFWCGASSEENRDYLYFYIDDVLEGAWSGSVAYTRTGYMVPSGARSFKWVYTKNGSGSSGFDTTWIDDIAFPMSRPFVVEDFETGDMSALPWITSGDGLWDVTNTYAHSGFYATESPGIGDNESASIQTNMYCDEGEMSFWYSVSSEENGDYLYFYIDDVLEEAWSGSVAYTRTGHMVASGAHSFKWVYAKDGSGSGGFDATWIDDICFPGTVGTDSDGDGLTDELENSMCTDPFDADTDDDGISDGVEDANHNGVVDYGETDPCDIDTDNDGIQDGTELGYTLDDIGPDTDTDIFQPDLDPSTTTNPLNSDTDGDGLSDGQEDTNHNGMFDPGELDPNHVHGDVDGDGNVDLADAILALQVMAGINPSTTVHKEADVNGDGKIGIEEVIYILQKVSGLR